MQHLAFPMREKKIISLFRAVQELPSLLKSWYCCCFYSNPAMICINEILGCTFFGCKSEMISDKYILWFHRHPKTPDRE